MLSLYAGIFLVSAATLLFELTLTRLFAVTQWYHFAFLSVSVALLGLGASGTWLALHPPNTPTGLTWSTEEQKRLHLVRLSRCACLLALGILVAYLAINHVPFDSYRIAWERRQLLYLALYYTALVVPFFLAGVCVGLPLAAWPQRAGELYAANLAGSAVGSLGMLALVPALGGTGAVVSASFLAVLAAGLWGHASRWSRQVRSFYLALAVLLLVSMLRPPPWFALRLSPYKTLSTALRYPQARLTFSRWNAFSRVDVVESAGIHAAPGLSLGFTGQIPRQLGLTVDGGNLSPITCLMSRDDEAFLKYLPTALPFVLRPGARVLLIDPRAGLDLWVALYGGASSVVAVESNPLVVSAVREQQTLCGPSPYADPRVTLVTEEVRGYLQRSAQRFDVVLLSLSDTYQPVVSGAYGLSENYAYTLEAAAQYLQHLDEDGLLVVTRWVQSPPNEELRACALVAEALQRTAGGDPVTRVIAFRTWSTATILAKRTPFSSAELAAWKEFCAQRSFDLIYYDGMSPTEANRYNVLPNTAHFDGFRSILGAADRPGFLQRYPYEISPPSDDRPFFFHYFRWSQTGTILESLGKTWQPFGGSGFLILIVLLVLVVLLSVPLILLPLAARGRPAALHRGLVLLYFACLGLGYLLVEMPLLQQFILFLDKPAYSFALVLFSLLLFSGLGSSLSERLSARRWLLVLAGVALAYPWFLARLFAVTIAWRLFARCVVAAISLAPLGFLLGLPLPLGIRVLRERAAQLVPWAWAVNGCASVVGSILAALGAVSFGFSRVLVAGALAYGLAWVIMLSYSRPAAEECQ